MFDIHSNDFCNRCNNELLKYCKNEGISAYEVLSNVHKRRCLLSLKLLSTVRSLLISIDKSLNLIIVKLSEDLSETRYYYRRRSL